MSLREKGLESSMKADGAHGEKGEQKPKTRID